MRHITSENYANIYDYVRACARVCVYVCVFNENFVQVLELFPITITINHQCKNNVAVDPHEDNAVI